MLPRKSIVSRHNPTLRALDSLSPFSVGNGEFAFTTDITGLQTFPEPYETGMPLHTLSNWGWHSFPNPKNYRPENAFYAFDVGGRDALFASNPPQGGGYSRASEWLRANPHRMDLGRVGLILRAENGDQIAPEALKNTTQTLNLWEGRLESEFDFDGQSVRVTTVCHPESDCVAVRIEAAQVQKIGVKIAFSYPMGEWKRAHNWRTTESHQTTAQISPNSVIFERQLDADSYFSRLEWTNNAGFCQNGPHEWRFWPQTDGVFEFRIAFSPQPIENELPSVETTISAAKTHWETFWQSGAALDFSACTDPRAAELERRVVLSQYLCALNCAGSIPPQETGLVCNSWFGKFHLEMHYWHAAHFAAWNRLPLLERSLGWYQRILPIAQKNAARQGYRGARWPKMVDHLGLDSPSSVATFLIWQQPHPLYFAEQLRRARPNDAETLEKYREIVFQTAEWMADYPRFDEENKVYILGPGLIPAQESYGGQRTTNLNPTFELAQWHWALGIAQEWREKLGLEREPKWDHVRDHLPAPTVHNGIYQAIATPPFLVRRDHPSMLGALGVMPQTPLFDAEIMSETLGSVWENWELPTTWGWDYPMIAMTAARLGRPEMALDALFLDSPKNRYLPNGHNYQDARLPLYLPGNGGLLLAVAMMAGGWDGAPEGEAPGFPKHGTWNVAAEGFARSI